MVENLFIKKVPLYFETEESQLILGDSFKILAKSPTSIITTSRAYILMHIIIWRFVSGGLLLFLYSRHTIFCFFLGSKQSMPFYLNPTTIFKTNKMHTRAYSYNRTLTHYSIIFHNIGFIACFKCCHKRLQICKEKPAQKGIKAGLFTTYSDTTFFLNAIPSTTPCM